jgi:OOP family OmpA-OmpF porin
VKDADDELAELRQLIVGYELDELAAIRDRLDDAEIRRREVAEVLPAVLLDHTTDPRFTHALTPSVERAITASVRKNPAPLADALFPVMGPAIRKAVMAALTGVIETLNRTVEHSLSWRSIGWRLEALRTGKSFAEVMLRHTVVYRVEQVFLIERRSGLLLQHVADGSVEAADADMVSGMLTAIRDFAQDSFRVADADSLEALKVGELSVWVEQGPSAVIAAVLRGTAARPYRTMLQAALERIHLEFADEFDEFKGDASAFEGARPTLEACLRTEYQAHAKPGRRTLAVATAVVAIALLVWGGFALRARSRWQHYLAFVEAEPGIVVLSAGRSGGRYFVSGLRDPLARDPAALFAGSAIDPADVDARWESYYAGSPDIALARATQTLQPPEGTTLTLADGVLSVSGAPPLEWLAEASRLAPLVPGVAKLDATLAVDAAVKDVIDRLGALSPLFVTGQAALADGQDAVLRQLVDGIAALDRMAGFVGRRFRVEVVGHTDADGPPEANLPLSRQRAAFVHAALQQAAGRHLELLDVGVGSDEPAVRSDAEADKQRNRRVTVRVTPVP